MEKIKKDKKETFIGSVIILIISQIFIKLLGLAYRLYLTNKEGFGDIGNAIYGSGYQIYALLLTLSSVGVPNAISKLISERISVGNIKSANKLLKISFVFFGMIGLLGTILLYLSSKYLANNLLQIPEAELTLKALAPALFFVSIISVIRGYFNGIQKISITAKSQILEQLYKSVLTIVVVEVITLLRGTNTLIMAAGANLATTFSIILTFLYLIYFYKFKSNKIKFVKYRLNEENERVKKILKQIIYISIPISLTAILTSLNKNVDSFTTIRCLKNFMDEEQAKIQYGILSGKVDTIITLPMSLNIAFATALVPVISSAKAINDIKTIKDRISFSLLITMLIGMPCTAGIYIFSDEILKLLFPNVANGGELLALSAFTIFFSVIIQTLNGALQGLGRATVPMWSAGIGLIIKIILNIFLISKPEIGIKGAVIASIVNNIIVFLIEWVVLRKEIKYDFSILKFIIKPLIATWGMSVIAIKLYNFLVLNCSFNIAIIISIIIAAFSYLVMLFIFKIIKKEDVLINIKK